MIKLKKAKVTLKCAIKRKLKFEDSKNYLEENKLEKEIHHLEKNEIDTDSLRKNLKELIKRID